NATHMLALNHVDFGIQAGESIAVMGPSGSGKSTLLHALAGIITPTAGNVMFRGANLARLSDADRTKLRRSAFGFVFQSGQLLPELPAIENIALPMMLGGASYQQATDTAMLWLERLGLRQLAQQRPGEMSGGQMQRIAIARALAAQPAVIFADEPTGARPDHRPRNHEHSHADRTTDRRGRGRGDARFERGRILRCHRYHA
uniref:ABC transporter ATP-binding protein n=1 Tax=Collinsella stercoris TaxID=147206 RepID=UPI003AF0BB15